jgi:nanoRNase/pAp phosphatase (c-di-AMP/oligoRNAs hydrolase)
MLNETQQIYEAIKKSQQPLITFHREPNSDMIASSLALSLVLEKLEKKHTIVSSNLNSNKNLQFLPNLSKIQNNLTGLKKFIISLDLSKTALNNLHYQIENDKLNIFLDSKNGNFEPEDLRSYYSDFKHDLIIILNTPDLESLGKIYENNPDFFYHTPVINIDHLPENENFGHFNVINVTATSVAEIIYDLIENIDPTLFDEDIATCLLAGLIDKTQSFKSSQVTPKSLQTASQLIAYGARRQEIIQNFYQTKSLSTLKLWGRALLKLETDTTQKLAWSILDDTDFQKTKTTADDLQEIFDEMLTNIPTLEVCALFYSFGNKNFALIKSLKNHNLFNSLIEFKPQGTKNLILLELDVTPQKILEKLQFQLK